MIKKPKTIKPPEIATTTAVHKKRGKQHSPIGTTRKMISIRVSPKMLKYLRTTRCMTATLENAVKSTEDFKNWLQNE